MFEVAIAIILLFCKLLFEAKMLFKCNNNVKMDFKQVNAGWVDNYFEECEFKSRPFRLQYLVY